ncbi:MAG: leucine-rich repeat domain-containing protein, partial [Muribaculaceae bacterium]|nr:leucine-rich repeat domain-containing protein [Muribaculaceae bacterium]
MSFKKIIAVAAAFVMAAGIGGAFPENTVWEDVSITASAASDFKTKTDSDGLKYVYSYTGKGGDIKIPSGVAYVEEKAFAENTKITGVTFPKSCDFVSESAFAYCTKLKKVVFEGDADLCPGAFYKCVSLQSVTVNGSIREGIGSSAFENCQALTTVKIKGNAYDFWIGPNAFYNCYSLTSVNIPGKCEEIYDAAFLNCFNLTKLTIPAKTEINPDDGKAPFGYAELFTTEDDCNAFLDGESDYDLRLAKAGGKSGYSEKYTIYTGSEDYLLYSEAVKYTPKAITLTVTKGSPAEKWAKANGVKYVY